MFLQSWNFFGDTLALSKMSSNAIHGMHTVAVKPCINCSRRTLAPKAANFGTESKPAMWKSLTSSSHISSRQSMSCSFNSGPAKKESKNAVVRAISGAVETKPLPGLPIDLRGQILINLVFVLIE